MENAFSKAHSYLGPAGSTMLLPRCQSAGRGAAELNFWQLNRKLSIRATYTGARTGRIQRNGPWRIKQPHSWKHSRRKAETTHLSFRQPRRPRSASTGCWPSAARTGRAWGTDSGRRSSGLGSWWTSCCWTRPRRPGRPPRSPQAASLSRSADG